MVLDPENMSEIEDVTVYLEKDGSRHETDLRTVRDEFYGMVDDYLERHDYGSGSMGTGSMGRSEPKHSDPKAEEHYSEWLESIEDINVEMDIETPTGAVTVQVNPRTDFSFEDVQTSPNIMKVKHNGSTQYAIREWNHYVQANDGNPAEGPTELEQMIDGLGWGRGAQSQRIGRAHIEYDRKPHDEFGEGPKTYNMGTTDILSRLSSSGKHFNRNSHDDELYSDIGTQGYNADNFAGGIVMIPELMLESAMHKEEGIEQQLQNNELASPVTPSNVKLLDLYDDMAFALRPWGNSAMDGGIYGSEESWGDFYGTMEGLGLVSTFDRKDEFIEESVDGGHAAIKFFDPEVVAYTDSPRWFMGSDWDDMTDQLAKHANAREASIEQIKDRKKRVAKSFDDRIDVLDEVPRKVDRDLFPRDKIVETRI